MLQRLKSSSIFEYQLEEDATCLRKQAEGMPDSIRREELIRKAGQIDVAAHIHESLASPGLKSPD